MEGMAGGDEWHVKEPVVAGAEDKFPEGLRVLAVDDNPVCLRILEILLRKCKYEPTTVTDARKALEMLRARAGGEDQFDLVITDVHMPDMDGFALLEQIGLQMDLPVIMLSVDGEKDTVCKGIEHGACDFLVKPVSIRELKNIWQHVLRKNLGAMNHNSSDSDDADADADADQRVEQPVIVDGEQGGEKGKKCSKKKKKNEGDSSDENKESTSVPTTRPKRPRVSWTGELHRRFLAVINQLGADRVYPKTILKMMNVDNLTRASVASHLQKYRIYLKKVNEDPIKYLLGASSDKWNAPSCMTMNIQRGQPSSALAFGSSSNLLAAPSALGHQGVPAQSMNWAMGAVGHGGSTLRDDLSLMPDTRRHHAYGDPHVKSFDAFSSSHSDKEYANFLPEKMLDASHVVPYSHHAAGNSFANMPNRGVLEPVHGQFSVQPPKVMNEPSTDGMFREALFLYQVGNSSNPWQNVASSSFPGPMDGAPLIPSQVNNIPQMYQLPSFGASPGQMPMFQNEQQSQMEGVINNNTAPVAGFTEQMAALFNVTSKTAPVEMTSDNFSPMAQMINGRSTSSPLPNLQTGSFVAPPTQMVNGAFPDIQDSSVAPWTRMVNGASPDTQDSSVAPRQMLSGGDASGTLPMQEGLVDQQAPDDDQPIYSNAFFLDDILASMPNQDFNDDAFFGGEC